jgi:hypothetical protein
MRPEFPHRQTSQLVVVYFSKVYWYLADSDNAVRERSSLPSFLTIFATVFLKDSMNSSTTPTTCRPAVAQSRLALNNKACFLMKNGWYDDGARTLMKALRVAMNTSAEVHTRSMEQDDADSILSQTSQVEACMPEGEAIKMDEYSEMCMMQDRVEANCQSSYLYTEPVYLSEVPRRSSGEESIASLSFIIMFNLALCHHMKGVSNEDEALSQRMFAIAKRLYELTFQMQAQDSEINLLLTSALLNNLSLVHKALGNGHEAEQCNQLLLSTLLLLVDMGGLTPQESAIYDLTGFLGNVMHLIVTQSPVASAA